MPKTPPLLLPPFTDQSKQTLFSKNNDPQADDDELIGWDSFERLEREYEETYMTDNAKTEVESDYCEELPERHDIYRQDPIEHEEDSQISQDDDTSPKDQESQVIYSDNDDTHSPNPTQEDDDDDDQEPQPMMPVSHGLMTLHERMKLHLDGIASLMEKIFEQIHQTQEGHEELAEVVRAHRLALAERGTILNQQCEHVRAYVDNIETSVDDHNPTSSYPSPISSRKNEHIL